MLVKLQGTWRGHEIYVNPAHVKTLRPMTEQFGESGRRKSFPVAGHTNIEYAVGAAEDELFGDVVIGTLDEVAAKLNGSAVDHNATASQLFAERRAGMGEAWFGAATHPGLPAEIAAAFHLAARRMKDANAAQ